MKKNDNITQALARAIALHQAGNLNGAENLYRAILVSDPKNVDALTLLGTAHLQRGLLEEGIRLIRMSLDINRRQPDALNDLGNALLNLRRYDEALASYEKAIALKPDYAAVYNNMGTALYEMKRDKDALASFNKAVALNPHYAEAYSNRGGILQKMKRYGEALANYEKAIELKPNHAAAYNNMGNLLSDMKRYDEAVASLGKAIALEPGHAAAYNNRGNVLSEVKRYDEALADYEKAMALQPDIPYLLGGLLHTKMHLSNWQGVEELFDKMTKAIEAGKLASTPFALVVTAASMAQQRKCAENSIADKIPPSATPLWNGEKYSHDRIRIGYFSADFHNHPTAYLMAELFERHDRSRFEVTAFSFGPPMHDAMRGRLEKAFEHFIDVSTQSDPEIAQLARSRELDIAVDLKGFTQNSRTGIFALRPAPIAVNYLGYPGSMGASYIDYLIADSVVVPQAHTKYYSEKIVTLPDSYQANDSSRPISEKTFTRSEMGLPEQGFVFCCFNNSYKITPDVFAVWMRLLHQVPGSVLWLLEGNATSARNLRKEAELRGIADSRLIFARRMDLASHLARQQLADLFLDTLYCNAHTTASDALWVGLPVLTCLGQTFAGRVAGSLVTAVGLPELITDNVHNYEALALELATHPERLAAIKAKLARNKSTYPLFDTDKFRRHIESAYITMVERYQKGLPPESFAVTPL